MPNNEYIASLRLQKIPFIGDITAKKLIARCGSPSAIFNDKESALSKIDGVGKLVLRGIKDQRYLKEAEKEYAFVQDHNIQCILFTEPDYPEYLKHCVDGPLLMFSRGNIRLKDRKIISVVGTRHMTAYGRAFCERFIEEIAPLDPVIVSGFAYGVDICIQMLAVKYGLQTIGCLAHGLNQIYPREHRQYVAAVEKNGGFFTEFWSTSQPERENFLRRNRVIAGLSQATIVVESAEKGGSLVTADIACSYDRDLFALPGRAGDVYSVGCNNLIKQNRAHLITSAADLVYMLNWDLKESTIKPVQKQLFVELEGEEKKIYEYLNSDGKQAIDTIAISCKIPVFKLSSTLLKMEMKGVIRPLPGKQFEAI